MIRRNEGTGLFKIQFMSDGDVGRGRCKPRTNRQWTLSKVYYSSTHQQSKPVWDLNLHPLMTGSSHQFSSLNNRQQKQLLFFPQPSSRSPTSSDSVTGAAGNYTIWTNISEFVLGTKETERPTVSSNPSFTLIRTA